MMPPTCAGTAGPLIGGRNARREVARSMKIPKAWRRLSGIAASLSLALALGAAMFGAAPALSQNADCERLRQAISEATNSSGASQYQAAAERQAAELERMSAYSRSIGCDNHKFLFFGSEPPAQCAQISGQIQRMRANLDDLRSRAGGGNGGRGELIARFNAQCANGGPRNADSNPNNGGLLGALFGQPTKNPDDVTIQPLTPDGQTPNTGEARAGSQAVCVRTCDGSFFPVSYSANSGRLGDLDGQCHALCPNADVSLYTYPASGQIEQAVSSTGQRYVDSPNALKYRQSFDATCTCRRRGQSWADALVGAEARLGPENKGDIIVTPQKSLELSRPKADAKLDPKAKNAKGKPTPTPTLTPTVTNGGTDANGVDTTLSAAAAAISRDSSGILSGAESSAAPVAKDQGSTVEENGPDGAKRKVRIIDPAL